MTSVTDTCRPFLRWAGSKRKTLPLLEQYWPADTHRYVEPFAGSAALFFRIQPSRALLGDVNENLVVTLTAVRDNVERLLPLLGLWRRSKSRYYGLRQSLQTELDPLQRAAQFIYLNRYCFNGLYRTNLSGHFNVPYGGARSGAMPRADEFRACSRLLQHAQLETGDFETTLVKATRGDFVYLDPPYQVESRRVFREYGPKPFSSEDLARLREQIIRLDRLGALFLLTYANSQQGRDLARNFDRRVVRVRRNIAGFNGSRRVAEELLITNYRPKGVRRGRV